MPTMKEIVTALRLKALTGEGGGDREVTGGYASDLLSCVMARAANGNVWVTLQGHPNVVAVASLLNLAGVIVCEGFPVEPVALQRAHESNIPLFTTSWDVFTVVSKLAALGIRGVAETPSNEGGRETDTKADSR